MPSKYRLRYIFRPIIKVLAKALVKLHLSPNQATILMLIMSLCGFFSLVFLSDFILFAIFVFLTGIFDGIDGMIARLTEKRTSYGGFFDSVMDRFSEFFILLALLINFWNQKLWIFIDMRLVIVLSIIASLMISYTRARAENLFKDDYDYGLMARSERLFYLFLTMLIAYFINFATLFLFIYMLLVWATAIFRFIKIEKIISRNTEK
ncbi:MAG: CDP-alcohol phosphatidyltransferase family protein [Candidatus Lokiarchaeota archaeon]